jgi:hypothetical protein
LFDALAATWFCNFSIDIQNPDFSLSMLAITLWLISRLGFSGCIELIGLKEE